MSTVLVKRGLLANLPILAIGSMAFTTDTHQVFIGSEDGNIEISPNKSTKVLYQTGSFTTESSTIQLDMSKYDASDVITLYIGGLYSSQNVNYTLNTSTGVITKVNDITGPTWSQGYDYDIIISKSVVRLNPGDDHIAITSIENSVTTIASTAVVSIGIPQFNYLYDVLLVFKNGVKLPKNKFTIGDGTITSTSGNWPIDTYFDFVCIKSRSSAVEYVDGYSILNDSISKNALNQEARDSVNNILTDTATGIKYKLQITNGSINISTV